MRFRPTTLAGVFVVEADIHRDQRGSFARAFCSEEFSAASLNTNWPQHNLSQNLKRGVLRGMHYQAAPYEEIKLIRCVAGSVFDVLVDVRPQSPTFGEWQGFELSAENGLALYVPGGFAHGFQALEDATTLYYLMSEFYEPSAARGIYYADPALGIVWPVPDPIMSERDRNNPALRQAMAYTIR